MKKFSLLFVWLLSIVGVTQVWAGTLTETFDDVTVTSRYQLSNGWVMIHNNGNYQGFGGSYDYQIKSGNYDGETGNSLYCSYSDNNEYVVIPTKLTGTFTYYAKRAESSNGTVTFFEATKNGDTYTIGTQLATTSTSSSWSQKSFDLGTNGKYVAIRLLKSRIDQISASTIDEVSGPGLIVSGDNNGTLDFGMVNPGTTKNLMLSNPGTESITVAITTTGGFTADASKTIAAGGEETLAIAAPSATATGTVTIAPNPAVSGIDPVTISLSAVIKDPNKMFEDFSGNALPTDWTTTGSWTFTNGYASAGRNSNIQLTTPLMVFENDETFAFDAAGANSWEPDYGSNYAGQVVVQTSTDGTTFTDVQTFSGIHYNTWQSYSVTIPAGTKYVRFVASNASIDNVYGGQIDNTPRPKLEVVGQASGSTLSWGYSDVPAGTTKTITLKNDGTADLEVTIAATDDYTVDPASATVAANGGTTVVTIGTPAHDGNGVLTITPAEGSGLSPYTINLTSYYKEPKPIMSLDKTSVAFGKVNEVKSETVTVSNTGDGELVATIENSNTENFTVEPAESLTVAPGETGTITITYNYVEGTWGTFNANVKVTPNTGSSYDAKTITVSATSKDPNVWSEDFEEGTIPTDWINEGKWNVSTPTASGNNGTKMATISSYNAPKTLTTPCLDAKAGDQLTFYIGMQYDDEPLTIEYSNDNRATWNTIEEGVASYTASGDLTFTAPTDGQYYIRFTGTYAMLDNFNGFKLFVKDHDAAVTAQNIPATGSQYVEYTATVTVKEMAGKEETLTAKFFIGETQMGEAVEETIAANGEKTFTVTFTPEEAVSGDAYFTISNNDLSLESDKVAVEIAAAPTLDEADGSLEGFENWGSYPVVVLKYSMKAGWNTIVLPFAVSDLSVFGDGVKAYQFSSYTDGTLQFASVTTLNAQEPYVLYATEAKTEIAFTNVTMFRTSTEAGDINKVSNGATFQGTYAPIAAPNLEGKFGVVPSTGRIQKGSANASLKGFRAYFELPEEGSNNIIVRYGNDMATGIEAATMVDELNGNVYDLQGRKVMKAQKGLYIQNGKKIVVK